MGKTALVAAIEIVNRLGLNRNLIRRELTPPYRLHTVRPGQHTAIVIAKAHVNMGTWLHDRRRCSRPTRMQWALASNRQAWSDKPHVVEQSELEY